MTRLVPAIHSPSALTLTGYSAGATEQVEATASVGDLWRILWNGRRLIVATAGLLFILTLAYGAITPALYTASSEIIIDPRDRQVVVNDVNPSGVAPDGGVTQIESQARVIESSSVLLRAIAATALTRDPEFNGSGWLARLLHLDSGAAATDAVLEARTLRALKRRLAIKRADKVFVIEVVVTARQPEKAARLANAIADAYLVDQADAKAQAGRKASDALTARLAEQRARVQEAEDRIQQYKVANNIVTTSGLPVGEQQLADVNNQLAAAQSRTATLRAQVDQIDDLRRAGTAADSTAEAMQSTVIAKLREQEGTLVQRQAELEIHLGRNHPSVAAARSQLANVRQLIGTELNRISSAARADFERARANERMLAASLDKLKTSTLAMGQASVRLRELERDLEADRTVYAAFLVRARETREQAGIDSTNARVITRATPPQDKSWPPLLLLLTGALGSGLGLGAGLALIREYVAPTVLSRAQIEQVIGAPVIGTLPATALAVTRPRGRLGSQRPTPDAPPGPDATARLLAMVGLAMRRLFDVDAGARDHPAVRSVLLTSGVRDQWARRRACRMFASAAALRGQRVLLVDADMAGSPPATTPGLLDILHGQCLLDAIVDLAAPSGVALLGKGCGRATLDEGSSTLLAERMLFEARHHFDIVVIDGGATAENLQIAPLLPAADEVLLVVRLAATSQADVIAAGEAATLMGRPVSAVLLIDATSQG